MGWTLVDRVAAGWGVGPDVYSTGNEANPTYEDFDPSSDISAAWMVVESREHMCVVHRISITTYAQDCGPGSEAVQHGMRWRCRMSLAAEWSYAKTAHVAICLAALRAVGVPEPEIQEAMQ